MTPNKTSPFLENLRSETKEMHERLETTVLSTQLLSETVTLKNYALYLAAMKEVISFTEQYVLPKLSGIITDIDVRKKLPALNHDLVHLKETSKLPEYIPFKNEQSTDFLLGFMYVIEGSTLGGRVILKQLNKRIGIDENNGGSFFTGYGAQTGMRWSSFLDNLTSFAEEGSQQEIVSGAKVAFGSIHDYFEKITA